MLNDAMERYARETTEELKDLIRTIAPIPAPSHHEDLRVEFLVKYLKEQGAEGVFVDEAKNVIWPYGVTDDNDLVVIMAHTDVVFPDTTPLPFSEDEKYFYCPGVGDDTARLATLLITARYFVRNRIKPKCGILFVANSCEEGLGNLKGCRAIFEKYGSRVREFISNDGSLLGETHHAVGSERYKITVETPGGHSWGAFGNENAIRELSELIHDFYQVEVPVKEGTKTTYNVGLISGGTSVNTIAQYAECLYEYRSSEREYLTAMREKFRSIVDAHRSETVKINVELLGERPCNGDVDPEKMDALVKRIEDAAMRTNGITLKHSQSSTDANIPLSLGIPAVTIGTCISFGAHTREEKLDHTSLYPGLRYFMDVVSAYFE